MSEQLERLKNRLVRNKRFKTKTESGWIPSVSGEYDNSDVQHLIERVEQLEKTIHRYKDAKYRMQVSWGKSRQEAMRYKQALKEIRRKLNYSNDADTETMRALNIVDDILAGESE